MYFNAVVVFVTSHSLSSGHTWYTSKLPTTPPACHLIYLLLTYHNQKYCRLLYFCPQVLSLPYTRTRKLALKKLKLKGTITQTIDNFTNKFFRPAKVNTINNLISLRSLPHTALFRAGLLKVKTWSWSTSSSSEFMGNCFKLHN